MNTKQENVPQDRKRMMKEIFIGKLIDDSEQSLKEFMVRSSFPNPKNSKERKVIIKN